MLKELVIIVNCTPIDNDSYNCDCNEGWKGSDCQCNSAITCNGNGSCNENGICICNEGYQGFNCACNDTILCNGRGTCNNDGTCNCKQDVQQVQVKHFAMLNVHKIYVITME